MNPTQALRAGDELFCNYGYSATDCPVWYKEHHDAIFFDARATIPPITSAGIECWLEKVKQEVWRAQECAEFLLM